MGSKWNNSATGKHRVTVTLDEDMFKELDYWSKKKGMSINQYLYDALEFKVRFENKDYPLPTLEQARLNQLIDTIVTLSSNVKSLESVTISGFDSLLNLTRGDNYFLDFEDGEV